MKNLLLTILVSLLCFPVLAQHPFNLVRDEIIIPMRDGVKLGAILYRPESESKFPAIVYRSAMARLVPMADHTRVLYNGRPCRKRRHTWLLPHRR